MTTTEAEKEALVLVGFAATMEAIQRFEQALKGVAVLREDLPDGIGADTAWRRVERLLRLPMGQLEYAFPEELKDNFAELKRTRNWAAHEALVVWRFERNLGLRSDDDFIKTLIDIEEAFSELENHLSTIANQRLEQLGIDLDDLNMSRDEMRRVALGGTDAA